MMASYFRTSWILTCLMTLVGSGCCCTQGMRTCSSNSACSSCSGGGYGSGPILGMASCRGGCGETYVDEWVSEPPCIDDCGYCNSGCDRCRSGRPVRSLLRLLWGTPYRGGCSTGCGSGCSSGCDGGCSSCGGGGGAVTVDGGTYPTESCNCGGSHSSIGAHTYTAPEQFGSPAPAAAAPTPAPVAPSSAKRLSPAQQRATVARASTR